jgi:hypothetical protein
MQRPYSPSLFLVISAIFVAIALFTAESAHAQSGRRSSKSPEKSTSAAKVTLFVAIGERDQTANVPYYLSDTALASCIDRLRDATEVSVGASARGMSREDAVRRAKTEKDVYVVWLEIEGDFTNPNKQSKSGPELLYVRYTVFEPGAATIKAEGRTQRETYRTGGGSVSAKSSSRKSPVYSDTALKAAAREAADALLRVFHIDPPIETTPK